jgi:hypothetical protein
MNTRGWFPQNSQLRDFGTFHTLAQGLNPGYVCVSLSSLIIKRSIRTIRAVASRVLASINSEPAPMAADTPPGEPAAQHEAVADESDVSDIYQPCPLTPLMAGLSFLPSRSLEGH